MSVKEFDNYIPDPANLDNFQQTSFNFSLILQPCSNI
jgi:hypothetical protein